MPGDFLLIVLFVFILSALILMFVSRTPQPEEPALSTNEDDLIEKHERHRGFDNLDELVEAISHDKELLAPASPPEVPRIPLRNAKLGGGATDEMRSKTCGVIALRTNENPNEQRRYNRRLSDRRRSEAAVDEERRIVQRRVWLRRKEDFVGKTLLTVSDAADTLGVPVERIYKWLDESDIPFYQLTEGKRKAIRFEINELLQWFSTFSSGTLPTTDPHGHDKKGL
ncbi:MAG: DNA-binding protein [Candidatus Abyssobacteria bacterium SURF_17]|uniref:DNA-binding protein n=1 Tax=Candidatus Abyssobacteria bacterium SURF_17 TaxID=2093361 RepID=A0A419F4H5_9BACT|nr:MAG: DNA-binding protein [Candidatus Abyssubacteria bacterium SURF_17]